MKTIVLRDYAAVPERIFLGVAGSYGIEKLNILRGAGWEYAAISVVYTNPDGVTVEKMLGADDVADVPPEATSGKDGEGKITFVGRLPGERRISAVVTYDLYEHGPADIDNDAEPTPELVEQIMAAANKALDVANSVRQDADKGKFNGKDGAPGKDGGTGAPGRDGTDGAPGRDGSDGAPGKDGVSPTVKVEDIEGGHRVTITDATGAKSVDVMDGAPGKDGAAGKDGKNGSDGTPGKNGVSPTVKVEEIAGGHRVTVTDATGAKSVDVMDGAPGKDGAAGKDGKNGSDGTPGKNGVSPTVKVEEIAGGHRVTLTDASGAHAVDVLDGKPGKDGAAGKDAVVDATLTQDGQAADAKITGKKIGQLKEDISEKLNRTYEAIDAGKHLIVGADGIVAPAYSSGGASDVEIAGGWAELQAIANAGNAAKYFAAGDLVANTWKDTAANKTYDSPLRINHFSDETLENNSIIHGMWLQAKWASPFGVQFSQHQAIQVFDDGLAAGTYCYTFGDTNGNKGIMTKGTSFNFTLTKDVPAGGKIAGLRGYWDNDAPYTNLKMLVYDADGLTILETVSIAEGEGGTNLGTLTNLGSETLNSLHRIAYGDNCWKRSAIRQYLNSDKPKGQWWTAQSEWDCAPNELNSRDGYLCGIDPALLAAIKPVKVQTYRNTLCYDDKAKGNTPDITYDKVTLPSIEQMFITPQQAGEGEAQEYYVHLNGTGTKYAQWQTYPELRHYGVDNHNAAQHVRLRSANRSSGCSTWNVHSSGSVGNYYAANSWRFAPLVFIG